MAVLVVVADAVEVAGFAEGVAVVVVVVVVVAEGAAVGRVSAAG